MKFGMVLGTWAALAAALCTTLGQGITDTLDTSFKAPPEQTSSDSASSLQPFLNNANLKEQLNGAGGRGSRNVDLDFLLDADSENSLLGSFATSEHNGPWPLSLADLDFGDGGNRVNWGKISLPVPEPSSCSLTILATLAFAARALRKRY